MKDEKEKTERLEVTKKNEEKCIQTAELGRISDFGEVQLDDDEKEENAARKKCKKVVVSSFVDQIKEQQIQEKDLMKEDYEHRPEVDIRRFDFENQRFELSKAHFEDEKKEKERAAESRKLRTQNQTALAKLMGAVANLLNTVRKDKLRSNLRGYIAIALQNW